MFRYLLRIGRLSLLSALQTALAAVCWGAQPVIQSIVPSEGGLTLEALVDSGFDYVALRVSAEVSKGGSVWVSGAMPNRASSVVFQIPLPANESFFIIETGEGAPPLGALSGGEHLQVTPLETATGPMTESTRSYHILNRMGYGPSRRDLDLVRTIGIDAYINQQLEPDGIEETDERLLSHLDESFASYRPGRDSAIVPRDASWHYFKGTETPQSSWKNLDFDPSAEGWQRGAAPFGRGVRNLGTQLDDMQQNDRQRGYLTVFMRIAFEVPEPSMLPNLILRNLYDDGFVAYLNGKEIARDNVEGLRPAHSVPATVQFRYPHWEEFLIDSEAHQLLPGKNVLAIQLHNYRRDDFDALMDTMLLSRAYLAEFERQEVNGLEALQDLLHVRGIFSNRQLQSVLGEFWENHFTTDYDKVAEYLDALEDLDGRDLLPSERAMHEAAQLEYAEYKFFYENALGNFGDLLLFSATSPAQLIYLDNVLNRIGAANENYAREILELFAFGVDNRYSQTDIEQLSRAFTGWQIRKVRPDRQRPFPESATMPPINSSAEPLDTPLFDSTTGWRYFRGTRSPSRTGGTATLAWSTPTFRDSFWGDGEMPIGYDLDNPTIESRLKTNFTEMQGSYVSLFLRKGFTVENPEEFSNLLLSIDYDDGYIAFLNGIEIGRSESMDGAGRIASHRFTTAQKHLASEPREFVDVSRLINRLRPAPAINVLAIEAHNSDLMDSNFYIDATLVTRTSGEGSISLDDPNGVWTFRFNPEDHDYSEKLVFEGTEHEVRIPAGRTGAEGLQDALLVVQSMVDHPSTSEFICLKLINRFVSDEISLKGYHERTGPVGLLRLMDDAIEAWHSTKPAGNIRAVLITIFSQQQPENYFWSEGAVHAKIKTPIEYVNSIVRALDWGIRPGSLSVATESMGMHFFTRNDPDGWSEKGFDWINTGGLLERLDFASGMPRRARNEFLDRWNVRRFLAEQNLESAIEIVDYFDQLLFEGELSAAERNLFIQFANTKPDGNPSLFRPSRADYLDRAGDLIGLILSTPSLQFQ